MLVKAQLLSKKKNELTWCTPSDGYDNSIEVELDEYEEIGNIADGKLLPESNEAFPNGAPINGYVKIGNAIFRKR